MAIIFVIASDDLVITYYQNSVISTLLVSNNSGHRLLSLLQVLTKWAMLDVFIVALLVVSVKLGTLAVQLKLAFTISWLALVVLPAALFAQRYRQVTFPAN